MLDIPRMMLKELDKLIENKDKFNQYIKDGFSIHYDLYTFNLLITYKKKEYVVSLIHKNEQFYWHLTQYNNSFYETTIDNGLDIILFAIKENEKLYSDKKRNDEKYNSSK